MTKYNIKVIPKSSRTEIIEAQDDFLKIKLKALPEKGKANAKLIKFLSKYFKTPKSNITVVKGETGKNKIIEIN
jgi:uncharacterized protein